MEKWHAGEIKIIRTLGKKMKIKLGRIVYIPRIHFALGLTDFETYCPSDSKSAKEIVDLKERFKRKYRKQIKPLPKSKLQALDKIEEIINEAEE